MRNDIRQKAFTVVELLVVIAILGLLSSVILVSLKGTRKKASIASGEQFSSSIYHRFGSDAVGVWNFDDGTPKDSSGNGNDGTLEGDAEINEDSAKFRQGLSLDGSGDYVEIPDSDTLDIDGNTITVEAWINLDNVLDWNMIAAKNYSAWYFGVYGDDLVVYIKDVGYLFASNSIVANEWHHVAFSYDGSEGTIRLFLNGKEVDSDSGTENINTNDYPLFIGAYSPSLYFFDGSIDEVRLYEESLSSGQIRKHYVEEARKKGIAVK